MMFGLSKLYLYGAIGAALVAAVVWLRIDAVQDDRVKRELDRIDHIQGSRKIENETATDDDTFISKCVRSHGC